MSVFLLQARPAAQHFLAHAASLPQAAMPPHSSPRCLVQEPALAVARGLGVGVVAGAEAEEACAGDQTHAPAPFLTHSLLPSKASLKGPLPAAGDKIRLSGSDSTTSQEPFQSLFQSLQERITQHMREQHCHWHARHTQDYPLAPAAPTQPSCAAALARVLNYTT
jgi:hypothetical protein